MPLTVQQFRTWLNTPPTSAVSRGTAAHPCNVCGEPLPTAGKRDRTCPACLAAFAAPPDSEPYRPHLRSILAAAFRGRLTFQRTA